jgi:hypothetical protein
VLNGVILGKIKWGVSTFYRKMLAHHHFEGVVVILFKIGFG